MSETKQRQRFEAWVSAPPYERATLRFAIQRKGVWSSQYHNPNVQLAWEAWCEARKEKGQI